MPIAPSSLLALIRKIWQKHQNLNFREWKRQNKGEPKVVCEKGKKRGNNGEKKEKNKKKGKKKKKI